MRDVTSTIRLYKVVTSVLLADSLLPSQLAHLEEALAMLEISLWRGIEDGLRPAASMKLRLLKELDLTNHRVSLEAHLSLAEPSDATPALANKLTTASETP